ncbi:hypothetical protein M569_02960, partial [Genlisea aurea]
MEEAHGAASALVRNGVGALQPHSSSSSSSSSQSSRKEWRVVSDQSIRNSSNEELERTKIGHADERLIYERGREHADVDFGSITIDEGSGNDGILQHKLQTVSKQREELQHLEIELRAQVIVRSEILGFQKAFEAQAKEHANATISLQEQLREKEKKIHELERKMDEKERELHAIRLDNEAAWAKDDLLREQSKELQSYRRERDNSEAERAQHIKQICDLQEHAQDKERQLIELQEQANYLIQFAMNKVPSFVQHRIAQEAIIFKDEQIRDAKNWITHAQEMESFQSSANQSLQAELRDRTEQYNQLWLGYQRQFGDAERLHLHIHQLQLELADAREKSGGHSDGSHVTHTNSNGAARVGHAVATPLEVNDSNSPTLQKSSLQDGGNTDSSVLNTSQMEGVHGIPYASSLYGVTSYPPTALHPFLIHQQGLPPLSHVAQAHFHSLQVGSSAQNWPNQQALSDGENIPLDDHFDKKAEFNHDCGESQVVIENLLNSKIGQGMNVESVVPSSDEKGQVHDPVGESNGTTKSNSELHSPKYHNSHGQETLDLSRETKEKQFEAVSGHEKVHEITGHEQSSVAKYANAPEVPNQAIDPIESGLDSCYISSEPRSISVGKSTETCLIDERALLACVARTIGSGGKIRISSTLPNRLGKMLAPLRWHDYKRKYGKLDDFVGSHPELFLIEGDYIELREGAQKMIAAMAAVARVGPPVQSSLSPAIAVTPMARLKKV